MSAKRNTNTNTNRHGFKRISHSASRQRVETTQQIDVFAHLKVVAIVPTKKITPTSEQLRQLRKTSAKSERRRERTKQSFDRIIHPNSYRRNQRREIARERAVHLTVSVKTILEVK